MSARKKKETVEETAIEQAEVKAPKARKPKAEVAVPVAAAAPETVGVPVEMLSQLMAQIQNLTQEVGQLKAQVQEPFTLSEPVVLEIVEADAPLGEVTQQEIDDAQANPDLMPDDFFAEELAEEPVAVEAIDEASFEEKNPGLLAEIEAFNTGFEVKEALSLGELTQAEIDEATANPDAMPADFYAEVAGDDEAAVAPEIDLTSFEEKNPGLLDEIEQFNAENGGDSDAITAEEAGALLAGFDAAMKEIDEAPVAESGGDLSPDQIAAMFASSEPMAEPVAESGGDLSADEIAAMFASSEPTAEPVAESGGDLSEDEIAAMFASNDSVAPVVEAASLTDDEIAQAVDLGAMDQPVSGFGQFDYSDDDLDDLTEEDLVNLVRANIGSQADDLDAELLIKAEQEAMAEAERLAREEAAAATSEAELDSATDGVMSAAEIAALLETPDSDADVVPSESKAMSDDELKALLMQAGSEEEAESVPSADDFDNTVAFDQSASVPKAQPAAKRVKASGDEPELGAIKAVPVHLAVRAMALPMRFEDGKLLCLVAEPIDRLAIDRLSKETGFGIQIENAPIDQVVSGLRNAYAEVQDFHARYAVMAGAQRRPSFVEKIAEMWKKPA